MLEGPHIEDALTLRGFLAMLRRRKWIVLTTLVLVPSVAIGFSFQQPKLYQASARVLLTYQNLANSLTQTGGSGGVNQQPDRIAQTQVGVARTSAIAKRVLERVPNTGLTIGGFLGTSTVAANPNADILIFGATAKKADVAVRLANEYASQYTIYRRELDSAPVVLARANLKVALNQLVKEGRNRSQLYTDLLNRDQTLATIQALQTSNTSVIQQAGGAAQVQPRNKRAALLGVVLGLILGLALAYLVETFDTRVRNTDEIAKYLGGLPFLGRLPAPSKRLQSEGRLVMMSESGGSQAEPFRMFRTNLEFVMLDHEIRTVMVTSAIAGEGKSTTVANLAVALARSGKRVALVDLDLHRPSLHKFFQLNGPGVTQVALGRASIEKALVRIEVPGILRGEFNGYRSGTLDVLPAGLIPPDRGAFFDSPALTRIIEFLRERSDLVLVDAPPALEVGDAIALSRKVDGVFVVARLNAVRRPKLRELMRLLAMTSAQPLGFVATNASKEDGYAYGYGYADRPGDAHDDDSAIVQIGVGDVA